MSEQFSYDEVTYPSMVFPHIRPDQIGAIAILHGIRPDHIEDCRVLELGCGDGTNLLSIAYTMPRSHFVGLDLSAPRIEEANTYARELGLSNCEFFHLDLLNFEPTKFGEFDFIIAHGVYSWVPEVVRERILWIYEQSLKPNGVGFVSYNTYPGWHVREVARNAMLFQTEPIVAPLEKVANGLRFVEFLTQATTPDTLYRSLIEKQFEYLQEKAPESIFHDDLGTFNQPFYFGQFVDHIEKAGLRFISELEPMSFFTDDLPPFAQEALEKIWDDPIRREQYLDLIRGRFFRSTLVSKRSADSSYRPISNTLSSLFLSSQSRAISLGAALGDDSVVAFSAPKGKEFETNHPLIKSLLELLGSQWPKRFSYSEVCESLKIESGGPDEVVFQSAALRLISANILEIRCFCPQIALCVSERPKVSDFARWQADRGFALGDDHRGVTSVYGADVRLKNDLQASLVHFSDGSRTRSDIVDSVLKSLNEGPEMADVNTNLSDRIDSEFDFLLRVALLVG